MNPNAPGYEKRANVMASLELTVNYIRVGTLKIAAAFFDKPYQPSGKLFVLRLARMNMPGEEGPVFPAMF